MRIGTPSAGVALNRIGETDGTYDVVTDKKLNLIDEGRPSELVSWVEGSAAWTQTRSAAGSAIRYQRR
jgi:hypothetical protein